MSGPFAPGTAPGVGAASSAEFESPLAALRPGQRFVEDDGAHPEPAGPRRRLAVDPRATRVGIVTCGGLCPGVNTVIRGAVLELLHGYQVEEILGFRFGYAGLTPEGGAPLRLTAEAVRHIHRLGGSVLGMSRGRQDLGVMAETLARERVTVLIAIGGDGTMRGAHALAGVLAERGQRCAVVGVPKSIDNDLPGIDRTFGVETAVEMARTVIDAAHAEATSAPRGIGLVKLMGRDSGFLAASATASSMEVNFCLVPEVPQPLEGEGGLLLAVERRLALRGHAVIVLAEGCAVTLGLQGAERDASGNLRYASAALDAGPALRARLEAYFHTRAPVTLKYLDPSYLLRGGPPNAADSALADGLGRAAVHAAFCGRTDVLVGPVKGTLCHVPLGEVIGAPRRLDPHGPLWAAVLEATGQAHALRAPQSG